MIVDEVEKFQPMTDVDRAHRALAEELLDINRGDFVMFDFDGNAQRAITQDQIIKAFQVPPPLVGSGVLRDAYRQFSVADRMFPTVPVNAQTIKYSNQQTPWSDPSADPIRQIREAMEKMRPPDLTPMQEAIKSLGESIIPATSAMAASMDRIFGGAARLENKDLRMILQAILRKVGPVELTDEELARTNPDEGISKYHNPALATTVYQVVEAKSPIQRWEDEERERKRQVRLRRGLPKPSANL